MRQQLRSFGCLKLQGTMTTLSPTANFLSADGNNEADGNFPFRNLRLSFFNLDSLLNTEDNSSAVFCPKPLLLIKGTEISAFMIYMQATCRQVAALRKCTKIVNKILRYLARAFLHSIRMFHKTSNNTNKLIRPHIEVLKILQNRKCWRNQDSFLIANFV